MEATPNRFLPRWLATELRYLPWRLAALSLLTCAAFTWLALATWTFTDPSLNNATEVRSRNLTGTPGAALADALMQGFGLASVLLVLPIAALAVRILTGIPPLHVRLRLFFWVWAALSLPAFFSSLPTPRQWPLSQGLGGIAGDFIAGAAKGLAVQVPPAVSGTAAGLIFAAASAWALSRACGLHLGQFISAVKGSGTATPQGFIPPTPDEQSRSLFTRWAGRLSPQTRALAAIKKNPQEFWVEPKPPSKPASAGGANEKRQAAAPDVQTASGRPGSEERTDYAARMEPFFGPSPQSQSGGDGPDGDPYGGAVAPFRRLTSAVSKALNGKGSKNPDGAERGSFSPFQSPETKPRLREWLDMAGASHSGEPGDRSAILRDDAVYRDGFAPEPLAYETHLGHLGEDGDPFAFTSLLPPLSLLSPPQKLTQAPTPGHPVIMRQAAMLMDVLTDFGVKGRITGVRPGPVITLFELEPARGTKSSRVVGLADDIARSMGATAARIAVVPGRDAIGIELPNATRERVNLRALLETAAFAEAEAALPLALGKSIGGSPIVVDLARMPHLLIAGTTGSGKSVGINSMILSLLYRLPASQCNFIMIDPKMLELSAYDGIPHLLTPVVTDPQKAAVALKWTVKEMNARYERMSKLGVRNIASYNAKAAGAALRGEPLRRTIQAGFDGTTGALLEEDETFDASPMPYIVVVIDEMADLMMVAGKEVEFAVQRLSQMARAAGIHLIMATQRPSVDVVTGTIKANFPSRVSFQVTSKIDSRTIIGDQGAEQLLGAGDLLYMPAGGRIIRAHGPFVSDEEVSAVTGYLRARGMPAYRDDILEDDAPSEPPSKAAAKKPNDGQDLYADAIQIVLKDRRPTASYLQRRLGIGYSRAASLIERMEQDGLLGTPNRAGRREILNETAAS